MGSHVEHRRLVSVRMLRHDGIGLLVPVRVDPESGYRWYHAAQLPRRPTTASWR